MAFKEKKTPIKKFRSGAISAAIWKQSGQNGDFYNVTVQRAFKREGAQEWEHTDSFNRDDLPTASKLIDLCWAHILRMEDKAAEAKRVESGASDEGN